MYTNFHGELQEGKNVDQVLREYFPYDYKGVFIDIGAFEPIRISNSYHFEMNGWRTICFEANPEQIPLLKEHRKEVYNIALYDENKEEVEFTVVSNGDWTAGYSALEISEEYKRIFPGTQIPHKVKTTQRTLNSMLENELKDLNQIDIISLDIEGGELKCLKGFDLKKYKPKVMVIENVTNSNELNSYLIENNYRLDKHISYNQYWVLNN